MKKYFLILLFLISCSANSDAMYEEIRSLESGYSELEQYKYNKDVFVSKAEDHCLSLENGAINKGHQAEKIVIKYLCPEFEATFFQINTVFMDLKSECFTKGEYWGQFDEDKWNSLYYDDSKYRNNSRVNNFECLLDELAIPSSIVERMYNTNALMGAQDAEFLGIKVTWTYHPDNGLDMYFELLEPNI